MRRFPPGAAARRALCLAAAIALPAVAASAAGAREPAALPRFTVFGWVSPPTAYTTPERYAEVAGAGMNMTITEWDDPHTVEENRKRMDCAAANGIRCLVADDRFDRVYTLGFGTPESGALLDSIVADYRDHPGFMGYYFRDEPRAEHFPALAEIFAELRARDPEHPAWDNLAGIRGFGDSALWVANNIGYLEQVHPAVLCDAHYDFRVGFDYGEFVMNVAALRAWSLQYGIPFWNGVQLVPHANIRPLTEGELTWQVAMLLAYGARGVGYFTYWTPSETELPLNWGPAIITFDGVRTSWYDVVARLNGRVRPAGEWLAGLTWVSTQHAGSLPRGGAPFRGDDWLASVEGRAAIGRFVDAKGTPYLVVVNADSLAPRRVTLGLTGAGGVSRYDEPARSWTPIPVTRSVAGLDAPLDLAAGDFVLLRLDGTFERLRRDRMGPTLAVGPNPASSEARFTLDRLAGDARFSLVDVRGRRIVSRPLPAGHADIVWRGERDAGGLAPPGIYLATVDDARGTATRRLTWLGR